MKEQIFKILHNRDRMPGERFSDIEGKIENLVNQEVEKRIAERMPSYAKILHKFNEDFGHQHIKTLQTKWRVVIWLIENFLFRLTNPGDSQKTEGGGE